MSALNYRGFPKGNGYFDQLPKLQQNMVSRMVKEAFEEGVTAEIYVERGPEQIECRSRDGFSAFSHNKGGIEINGFTDLNHFWGSGARPNNKKAAAKIEAFIEQSLQYVSDAFFETHEALFTKWNLTKEDASYHRMEEIENSPNSEFKSFADEFSNMEMEALGGDESSVMYQIRAMYHGNELDGTHSMTVFASIHASDAPYHRRADSVSEVLITWKTNAQLKTRLAKALKEATEAGF